MASTTDAPTTGLLNLEKELVCFICTEVLYQPLTLIDCLHTFCGSCVKEWFSHQHRKASHSHNPSTSASTAYTCPTCRAAVKDAQHNAMINTLLDMFLAANPNKQRSAEEKADMARIYKAGDEVLPKVESSRRRERRRRDDDDVAARERRMLEEARERSLRDVAGESSRTHDRLAPSSAVQSSRSRDREERRERRREQERRDRRGNPDAAGMAGSEPLSRRRTEQDSLSMSPPPTSPRHPDAVEARQRARTVAHQASLRSLVSASESGTGTGDSLSEAQLMQEILSEGLLDGINVDELTEAEQDELSEVIAERYRQLHPQRLRHASADTENAHRERPAAVTPGVQDLHIEDADRRPRQASRQSQHRQDASPSSNVSSSSRNTNRRATTSSSQPAENETNLSPPTGGRLHARRTSDQSGRQEARSSNRITQPGTPHSSATRSATDLTDRPHTDDTASAERVRQLSGAQRAQTEPRHSPRASEIWRQGGVENHRAQPLDPAQVYPPAAAPSTDQGGVEESNARELPSTSTAPSFPQGPISEARDTNASAVRAHFEEPSISCARCARHDIQYEVFKHCSPCDVDLCLRCYRGGRGCDHWFGFGHAAMAKFEASHPQSRASQAIELPHVLVSRQYSKPPPGSASDLTTDNSSRSAVTTSSDPNSRLQEGHFCDRCGVFANACYWTCDYCNDGEWGFCNECINTQHCCTHPLLPIAHKSFAPKSAASRQPGYDPHTGAMTLTPSDLHASVVRSSPAHSAPSSAASATDPFIGPHPDYVQLTITTHCDVCTQPIAPSHARYHCPAHPSPTPQQPHSVGDYDICISCYHNLIKIGRIKRDDGPAGWRKCPNSHRMVVTAFEPDREGGQRRVIVHDLVGGSKLTEDDMVAWKLTMSQASTAEQTAPQSPPLSNLGEWVWREDSTGMRRGTRNRSSTLKATPGKFPPDGGFGKRSVALWSYYPEDGEEGRGELMFPKHGEISEIEEINEDWSHGVYAGDAGLLLNTFVRELQRS